MKLGIIGCGNMGSALAEGILSKKILPFNSIYVSDKEVQKTKPLHRKFGICVCTNEELAKKCDLIIIAIKPQGHKALLASISEEFAGSKHLISLMAGVKISKIVSAAGKKTAVTRAMPNIAALVGKSVTAVCHNKFVRNKSVVHRIFSAIGEVIEIDEKHMDAVTAVSGSGLAYFLYMAECLIEAGVAMGIKRESATKLAVETLAGSGALLDNLKIHPELLRKRVTSRKGTTEAALRVFKKHGFNNLIAKVVKAAARRSKELSA